MVFGQQLPSYSSDSARIAYLIAYLIASLKGAALAWGSVVWDRQGPESRS